MQIPIMTTVAGSQSIQRWIFMILYPKFLRRNVCWIRIHLSIDSTVSQLVMMIDQSVASEIYLNGKLIHRLGVLDVNSNEIKAINPNGRPFSFPFEKKKVTKLGHYVFQSSLALDMARTGIQANPGVSISLNTVEAGHSYYKLKNTSI